MRAYNTNDIFYVPDSIPDDSKELKKHLTKEFERISAVITALATGHINKTHVAPTKPRDGDIRLADGTNFNPGGGQGVYAYYNSTWNKLG